MDILVGQNLKTLLSTTTNLKVILKKLSQKLKLKAMIYRKKKIKKKKIRKNRKIKFQNKLKKTKMKMLQSFFIKIAMKTVYGLALIGKTKLSDLEL